MFLTKMRLKRLYGTFALSLLVALAPAAIVKAVCNPNAQSCSSSYQVTESFFGSGGQYACSTGSFCANQSAGELTVGKACDPSDSKCIQAGFNTNRTPYLEFIINTPSVDVGVLDTNETHVGTGTFQVKTYLSQGYQVTTEANAPSIPGHTFATPSASGPTPGTERFGINLVANSCPASAPSSGAGSCSGTLGANPTQDPDSTFSFGTVAAGYNTANVYKYNNGDTIATSTKSSGVTDYTISYIFNISNVTPAGAYRMTHVLVATSTF
jgi:hypothetical protein